MLLQVTAHSYHPEVNIGSWYVRPTEAGKQFMWSLLEAVLANPTAMSSARTMDQKLFDNYLRRQDSPKSTQWPESFPLVPRHSMAYKVLSFKQLPHWHAPHFLETCFNITTLHCYPTYVWEERLSCAYELGLMDASRKFNHTRRCLPQTRANWREFILHCPVECTHCLCNQQ